MIDIWSGNAGRAWCNGWDQAATPKPIGDLPKRRKASGKPYSEAYRAGWDDRMAIRREAEVWVERIRRARSEAREPLSSRAVLRDG